MLGKTPFHTEQYPRNNGTVKRVWTEWKGTRWRKIKVVRFWTSRLQTISFPRPVCIQHPTNPAKYSKNKILKCLLCTKKKIATPILNSWLEALADEPYWCGHGLVLKAIADAATTLIKESKWRWVCESKRTNKQVQRKESLSVIFSSTLAVRSGFLKKKKRAIKIH